MSFLFPSFLFALFAISVPIIIHLFNFRRYKKVHFSNVSFLQAIQLETRKRSRIRQWLILAARILTIACLVFAFAQPFIPGKNMDSGIKGDKAISIFIDNSFSMQAQGEDGQLQEMAIEMAREIINASSGTDKIQILTQDFEGRHQLFYTKDEALQLLEEIKSSSSTHLFSEIIQRQRDLLQKGDAPVKRAFIISDFQQSTMNVQEVKDDSGTYFQLLPLIPNNTGNLYIDSCWLVSPELAMNSPVEMYVRIYNKSNIELKDQVINFEINGEDKLPVAYSVAANGSVDVLISFVIRKAGFQWGRIYIDDAEILFDDEFFFSMYLPEKLNVMHIKGPGSTNYIDKLFTGDTYFNMTNIVGGQVDFSTLNTYHFIILDELVEISGGLSSELKKFVEKGGSVFVIPSASTNLASYNTFFNSCGINGYGSIDTNNTKLARIDKDHPYFKDVFESIPDNMDLPFIKSIYTIQRGGAGTDDVILSTASGQRFFVKNKSGKGCIYQLGIPLQESFSNFPKNILFVPIVIKAALQSIRSGELYYTIGRDNVAELNITALNEDRVLKIRSLDDKSELIPEQKAINNSTFLYFNNQVKTSGAYKVMQGEEQVASLAFNYSRIESAPETMKTESIQQKIDELGLKHIGLLKANKDLIKKQIVELDQGIRLWKLFIILALGFIACEILLARFMK
jgi:hypothetical protein